MKKTPKELGYYFPAEWETHAATWLSFPHNLETWPKPKLEKIYPVFLQFIKLLSLHEEVHINVQNPEMKAWIEAELLKISADLSRVFCHLHPTNDAWCRDYGPAFLINPDLVEKKIIVDWEFNAWGQKYPLYENDNRIPSLVADFLKIPIYKTQIVMEGGSLDFNGKGSVLTTKSCLLNPNRNRRLTGKQIEWALYDYYGIEQVLWLENGLAGDDTDGHIDNLARFVNEDTVITMIDEDKKSDNYHGLKANLDRLKQIRLLNGKPLNIIEIPMPPKIVEDGVILPGSYANFYIANGLVIVPIYQTKNDEKALEILEKCFPDREVIGLNSRDIIWGLGSFHCLTQQEPFA